MRLASRHLWVPLVAAVVVVGSAFSCGDSFSAAGDGGTTTAGGSGGTTTTQGGGGSGGEGGSGATTGTGGGTTSSSGVAGAGGTPPDCEHDMCTVGVSLNPECDPCVDEVCDSDPYCCTTHWDWKCVAGAYWACGQPCGANDTVTCNQQYALAPSYTGCGNTPGKCRFTIDNTSQSCDKVCSDYGGLCVTAELTAGGCAGTGNFVLCTTIGHSELLCECSHGCMEGPPCQPPDACTNSGCL